MSFERDGVRWFVLAWTVSRVGLSIGGHMAGLHKMGGRRGILVSIMLLVGILVVLPFAGRWLTPIVLLAWRFSRGLFNPSMTVYVQNRIDSSYRATYGSLQSFVTRIGAFCLFAGVGLLSNRMDYQRAVNSSYFVSAATLFVGFLVLLVWSRRRS